MKRTFFLIMGLGGCLVSLSGCGENLAGLQGPLSAPQNLKAFSVNESTVYLQWDAPSEIDSTFDGYILEYGSSAIDLSKNQLSHMVNSLPPGDQLFTLSSRRSTGAKGEGTSIRWAPATRFDSMYALSEYTQLQPDKASGMNVGSITGPPFTLEVNGSAGPVLDFYLFGGDGFTQEPLEFFAANLFAGAFRPTRFSTVTHSAPSLDLPLANFPADSTFTRQSIPVSDNTICYARVFVNNIEVHFVRIHVRLRAGSTYPDRVIDLRISLQRVAGLPFAFKEHGLTGVSRGPLALWHMQPPTHS